MSDSLWPHELQHTRPPCPSPTKSQIVTTLPSNPIFLHDDVYLPNSTSIFILSFPPLKSPIFFLTSHSEWMLLPSVQLLSRIWVCDPMDYSIAGSLSITNSWDLLKLMSIELLMPSNYLILCCPFLLLLQSFQISCPFPVSQLLTTGGQSTGVSASASVLPVNIQEWFPLWWTGWISLQSKGLLSLLQLHSSKASILGVQLSS